MNAAERSEEVAKRLRATLDRHGYGFQYAIVRAAADLFEARRSPWRLPVTEFPVEVRGHVTRADIIFEHQYAKKLLVCECKRTNVALSDWCFLKIPQNLVDGSHAGITFERVVNTPDGIRSHLGEPSYPRDIYHLAVEVRSQERGDSAGQGRGLIEEAATQVLRSVNGLVNYYSAKPDHLAPASGGITLIPVIFTTARLWVSSVDLSLSELETGAVRLDEGQVEQRGYLFYTYPISSNLRHGAESMSGRLSDFPRSLGEVLYGEYMRAIVVVSATGVEEYLTSEGFYS